MNGTARGHSSRQGYAGRTGPAAVAYLLTFAHPGEWPPDYRLACGSRFLGRSGRDYTVTGEGGLVRLPHDLADRLEARRRDERVRVTDRGIHYDLYAAAVNKARTVAGEHLHQGDNGGIPGSYRVLN